MATTLGLYLRYVTAQFLTTRVHETEYCSDGGKRMASPLKRSNKMYFHLIPEFLDFFRTVSTVEADYGNADENTHFLEL